MARGADRSEKPIAPARPSPTEQTAVTAAPPVGIDTECMDTSAADADAVTVPRQALHRLDG